MCETTTTKNFTGSRHQGNPRNSISQLEDTFTGILDLLRFCPMLNSKFSSPLYMSKVNQKTSFNGDYYNSEVKANF